MEIDLPHVLYLPTFAATAWYHDAIPNKPASLAAFLTEVERFAYEEYAPALMKGYAISRRGEEGGRREARAATPARPPTTGRRPTCASATRSSCRSSSGAERLIAGRIDSRFVGPGAQPARRARWTTTRSSPRSVRRSRRRFLDYLHTELKFGKDENYARERLRHQVGLAAQAAAGEGGWMSPHAEHGARPRDGDDDEPRPARAGPAGLLRPRDALPRDASTTSTHLDIPPEARERIRLEYYEAGHMMYLHEPSLAKFRDDVVRFVRDTDRL